MLVVKNITKKFLRYNKNKKKEEFCANDDINFVAKKGEILGILGPNGAGKTTLLRIVAGILSPSEGSVTFDGITMSTDEVNLKKNLAFLSGNTNIYKAFSTYELLEFCAKIYQIDKNKAKKRIEELIDRLEMKDFVHNRIERLSTGQKQRANIARCLVHDPDYYILDEPTNGLDIISGQIILDFIEEEKQKGKTILYSTHYMEEAENICDRVILMDRGKIIKMGRPEEINKESKTTNLRAAFFAVLRGIKNEK